MFRGENPERWQKDSRSVGIVPIFAFIMYKMAIFNLASCYYQGLLIRSIYVGGLYFQIKLVEDLYKRTCSNL